MVSARLSSNQKDVTKIDEGQVAAASETAGSTLCCSNTTTTTRNRLPHRPVAHAGRSCDCPGIASPPLFRSASTRSPHRAEAAGGHSSEKLAALGSSSG
eukprot:m.121427 g.121427  ORF g.121427 m.121427 type:complete len:99 (+) comp13385_c0_seq3:256-552(+)